MVRRRIPDALAARPDECQPPIAAIDEVAHARDHPCGVVGLQGAPSGSGATVGERRVIGLDEDHPILGDPPVNVGRIAHARRQRDPIGAVLDERSQRPLLALEVVEAGHHEHRVALAGGGLLEPGREPAVDRVGEIVEQQAEDVRPLGTQAARGRVRHVAELLGRGMDGAPRGFADPGVVLEGARRRRLGGTGDPGDVREDDPPFWRTTHQVGLDPRRRGDRVRQLAWPPGPGMGSTRTH